MANRQRGDIKNIAIRRHKLLRGVEDLIVLESTNLLYYDLLCILCVEEIEKDSS